MHSAHAQLHTYIDSTPTHTYTSLYICAIVLMSLLLIEKFLTTVIYTACEI